MASWNEIYNKIKNSGKDYGLAADDIRHKYIQEISK
jgi:hypothetical protein